VRGGNTKIGPPRSFAHGGWARALEASISYPQYQEDRARGVPPSQAGITTPKGNRDRYVDLSPQVVAVLKARRTAMREAAFAAGRPMPELVFTAPRGGRVNPRNLLQRIPRTSVRGRYPQSRHPSGRSRFTLSGIPS
jgi:integrase